MGKVDHVGSGGTKLELNPSQSDSMAHSLPALYPLCLP